MVLEEHPPGQPLERTMNTTLSKLTRKYQATIPAPVRALLKLREGDTIAFDIDGEEIRLRKAGTMDLQWAAALRGTLSEWEGPADEEAYRDL